MDGEKRAGSGSWAGGAVKQTVMPRHRVSLSASPMTGSGGASGTLRLIDSITGVSGVLERPPQCAIAHKADDDSEGYDFAISRRVFARAFTNSLSSPSNQRAQGMPGARCTRGLVCQNCAFRRTRAYRAAEAVRHPLRNGFTAYFVLSPVSGLFCHRRRRDTSRQLERQRRGARTTRLRRTPLLIRPRLRA
jgi:hypothetical protein